MDQPKQKGNKAVCQVVEADGKPCLADFVYTSGTSSIAYHLTSVHVLQKGVPAKRQKVIHWGCAVGNSPTFPFNDKELLCVTWASKRERTC